MTGTFMVAGDISLIKPIHQSHYPSNGLTVMTEVHLHAQTVIMGVWMDPGSHPRMETSNGSAHGFQGHGHRSQHTLKIGVENLNAHLNVYTLHEQLVYYAKSFHKDVLQAINIISNILQNFKLESGTIEHEHNVILHEQYKVDKQHEEAMFDHLHAVVY
jgi:processing peptidase subunit beta